MSQPESYRHYRLDENNIAVLCSFEEWCAFQSDDRSQVKQSEIGPVSVSTIFIGLGHPSRPLFFETMTFGPPPFDYNQVRTATYPEAILFHDGIVQEIHDYYAPKPTK